MAVIVKNLSALGQAVVEAFEDNKKKNIMDIYSALMLTTPEATGTLKSNWRLSPGFVGNRTFFIKNTGEKVTPNSIKNAMTDYKRNWKKFSLYNNSPYVGHVNNGEGGGNSGNQNFIQKAVSMAVGRHNFKDNNA